MTSKQYRAALAKLGMSQGRWSKLLRSDRRTSRRWANDESPVPESVAMVLGLMVALSLTADRVEALLNRPPRKPRKRRP
jgi:hypothetical protein